MSPVSPVVHPVSVGGVDLGVVMVSRVAVGRCAYLAESEPAVLGLVQCHTVQVKPDGAVFPDLTSQTHNDLVCQLCIEAPEHN